jgi:multicomponent Na+:H+ antiporter subunit G
MDIIVCLFLFAGLFFFTGGSVGILRFPDFYSRLHPAGNLDTLGSFSAIAALALFNLHHFSLAALLTSVKILLIVVFVFLTSPTATHAIVDAGVRAGLAPWTKGEKRR